jgi:hypothetical protein
LRQAVCGCAAAFSGSGHGRGFAEYQRPRKAEPSGADRDGQSDAVSLAFARRRRLGWDAYLRYSALTVPMIKARGGTLLWTGDAKAVALGDGDANQWDYLALVYYPSVAAFLDMMTSADYEAKCDPHRRNGCEEHVIICTKEAYSKFRIS